MNRSSLKANGISSVEGYNRISNASNPNISWSSNKTGVTERQLYDQVTRTPVVQLHKSKVLISQQSMIRL